MVKPVNPLNVLYIITHCQPLVNPNTLLESSDIAFLNIY